MSRITIQRIYKEVEKPPGGGGKGIECLYSAEILIDAELALTLRAADFRIPGQFDDFLALLDIRIKGHDADPLPLGLTRPAAINELRLLRAAQKDAEEQRQAAGFGTERDRKERERRTAATRYPIDALLQHIDACGFPRP